MRTRLLLGAIGIAMIGYGGWRIIENRAATQPVKLGEWLIGGLILHDGILSWLVLGVGWLLARAIPGRARAYVQGGLIAGGLVTVVAGFLIYRQGESQPGQALLTQNYGLHLVVLLAAITLVSALAYLLAVRRDASSASSAASTANAASAANVRPDDDHTSST